jgi:hypothetical protein
MMTLLWIIGIFISIVSLVICIFLIKIIRIQLAKVRTYESWIVEFKEDVKKTLEHMEGIDSKGTFATSLNEKGIFQSDDEVGQIFSEIKVLIEKLNQRTE